MNVPDLLVQMANAIDALEGEVPIHSIKVRLYNDDDAEVFAGDPTDALIAISQGDPDHPHLDTATKVYAQDYRDDAEKLPALPKLFMGKSDRLEVFRDPSKPLWCAGVKRGQASGDPHQLHLVFGSTPEGSIMASQHALEEAAANSAGMVMDAIKTTLADYNGAREPIETCMRVLGHLDPLPDYEWVVELRKQVRAKLLQLPGYPRLLKQGIDWHLSRVREYEADLIRERNEKYSR